MTQGSRAFLTVGVPLFVLTVSGFYGLSHLVQGKFDVQVSNACLIHYNRAFRQCMPRRRTIHELKPGAIVASRRKGKNLQI